MALAPESLSQRTYNVTAMSFTPEEISQSVMRHVPDLQVSYAPDSRQKIADSWPQVFDDSEARRDWNWRPDYDLDAMVDIMIDALKKQYN